MAQPTPFITDDSQDTPEQQAAESMARARGALEQLIATRLKDAVDARQQSGIEVIWQEDEDQYNGFDDLSTPANTAPPGYTTRKQEQPNDNRAGQRSRVFLNITKPKTDASVARVQQMLLPHDDKPWEIGPTPVPELANAAAGMDDRMLTLADGEQAPAKDVAAAALAKAEKAATRMSDQIEDWFVEGSVYAQMRKTIRDAGRIGTGILKGPIPTNRRDRKWEVRDGVALLMMAERLAPNSRAKSPWDVFPDPSCGENPHDGAFIFDRDYLTGRRLRELAQEPDYDREAIAAILREGPRKRSRYDDRELRENQGQVPTFETDTFEVFYYYGDIPPDVLLATGMIVPGLNDADPENAPAELAKQVEDAMMLATVPVVVATVNDRIIKISLNPLETGEFPFDFFVWEPVDGQPWGRGVPRKMAVAQKGVNAATRAMLENAGMNAGPQVVMDKTRIEPANGVWEITGRKLWYWKPGDEVKDVRFAFQSFMIDSAQPQLQAIIDFFLKMADELSNLPLLLQGVVGNQAPETLGGQAMAQANATSPLLAIAKQFDDQVVVPHLKRYYAWAMQDPAVPADAKGDMQCRARGSTVLVYRDVAAQFLPQLASMVADPRFRLNPEKWMAEVLRGNRVNPSSVQYSETEAAALAEQQSQEPPPKDPRVEAAEINAQAKEADRQVTVEIAQQKLAHDAQQAELDRASDLLIKHIEREIQSMEFANERDISLEQVRGMLTKAALDIRNRRELFAAEREFAVTDGEGRGL